MSTRFAWRAPSWRNRALALLQNWRGVWLRPAGRLALGGFIFILAAEAYLLFWQPVGLPSAFPNIIPFNTAAAKSASSGMFQTFRMGAPGFSGLSVYPLTLDSTNQGGDVVFEVWDAADLDPRIRDASERLVRRMTTPVHTFARARRFAWNFDPIEDSKGHRYRIAIHAPVGVRLLVTQDRADLEGMLIAEEQQQAGHLAFETRATRDTVAKRVADRLRAGSHPIARLALWTTIAGIAHVVFLGVLLAVAVSSEPKP
ncbi:MAG: hypothetical protein AB1806_18355 [Acidobacteriota bacterium]